MDKPMGIIQLTLLAIATIQVHSSTLFGVHQTGKYWGAKIDSSGHSSDPVLELYPSFSQRTGSVSYDPVTSQSLFELYEPHAIAYGPMCTNSQRYKPQVLFNMSHVILERPDIGEANSGKISAFAMYNSEIYFLHFGTYLTNEEEIFYIFSIRKFQTCDECGQDPYDETNSQSTYPVMFSVRCSVLVTEALRLSTEEDVSLYAYEFEGGKSLKVAKQAGSRELNFYFQVGKIYNSESRESTLNMILYRASSNGQTEEVHTQEVSHKYFEWKMYAIGSVDYKDGLLCWTTAEQLFCRTNEGEVKKVVGSMDHITNDICTGNDPNHLMDISGVSIVKNKSNKKVVAFGCSPNSETITGAGVVTMRPNGDITMKALRANNKALSAGSVFTVHALQEDCSYEPRPKICVRLSRTTIPPTTLNPDDGKPGDGDKVKPGNKGNDGGYKPPEGGAVHGEGGGSGQICHSILLIINTVAISTLAIFLS